jgi:glycosyltransferase involved in cell wall biosynthesis
MNNPDISLIMTFHDVGRVADATIQSANAAIEYAEKRGIDVELIFVLDRPDAETEYVCKRHLPDRRKIFMVDYGSVALTRNFGVEQAQATFVAHMDSDDLFSENWLHASYVLAAKSSVPSVYHPEAIVHFEGTKLLVKAIESDDLEYLKERMWPGSLWGAHACASRDIYLKHKFPHLEIESGFGYEDWHWACETLAAGIKHRIVPDTLFCYRAKTWKDSLYTGLKSQNLMLGRTSFYNLAFQDCT